MAYRPQTRTRSTVDFNQWTRPRFQDEEWWFYSRYDEFGVTRTCFQQSPPFQQNIERIIIKWNTAVPESRFKRCYVNVSVHPLTSFCIPPTLKRSDTHDTFENAVQGEIFENGSVYYAADGQTNGSFSGVDREMLRKLSRWRGAVLVKTHRLNDFFSYILPGLV